jgi:two-component system sensor histidine kinase/response regulator
VVDEAVLAELREYQKPGEADFLTELIGVFKDYQIFRLNQMRDGLNAIDGRQVSRAAHALKGASGELGAHRMREICSRLESSTADGSIATALLMVPELEAEAERVNAALARHCVDAAGRIPA